MTPTNDAPGSGASDDYLRAALSLATGGEWYVWTDSDNGTTQLLSRTHGAITPRLPLSPQAEQDLRACAAAVNRFRPPARATPERSTP
jgi:hypothetical protein